MRWTVALVLVTTVALSPCGTANGAVGGAGPTDGAVIPPAERVAAPAISAQTLDRDVLDGQHRVAARLFGAIDRVSLRDTIDGVRRTEVPLLDRHVSTWRQP